VFFEEILQLCKIFAASIDFIIEMLLFSFIVAVSVLINVHGVTTQESSISSATVNSLNNMFQNVYDEIMIILSLTGDTTNIPLSSPTVYPYINVTGSSQQSLFANSMM
jgi:hypothetical protein